MFPNGFPANGLSWFPQNTQIPPQLPMPGIPFQQQLHGNQGSLSTTMLPGMQPNMFAQSIYATGLVGQNQMAFGMGSPFQQIQPPAQQGFPSNSGAPLSFIHVHLVIVVEKHFMVQEGKGGDQPSEVHCGLLHTELISRVRPFCKECITNVNFL
ncbi:hypothetical protein ACSQ67_023562 [Phaseolus vulgaris]